MSGFARAPSRHGADLAALEPGFADPVHDAQASFRAVLEAMAHPGKIVSLPISPMGVPPAPLRQGSAAIALTLCDSDTSIWLDTASPDAANYLTFHCGARFANAPGDARFAFITDADAFPALNTFALGSDEYPERGATLVVQVSELGNGSGVVLRGPGIRGETQLKVAGLPERFWVERADLAELFPRGVDVVFVVGDMLAALPRSTRVVG